MPYKPNRNSWDDDDADERDWEEHDYDEDESDDEADYGDDDDDVALDTERCPHCRAEIYEEAEQCPECGEYVMSDDGLFTGKPLWIIVTALVLFGAFLLFAIR